MNQTQLFSVQFKNLTERSVTKGLLSDNRILTLDLRYDSESGLVFLGFGDSNYKLLSLQNTADTGERLISSIQTSKFKIPGRFDQPYVDYNNLRFVVTISGQANGANGLESVSLNADIFKQNIANSNVITYARTNII